MLRSRLPPRDQSEPRVETLLRQARRFRLRGETRRAMLAARQACFESETDPRVWALYGDACRRARRNDDAKFAIRRAIWLRERERDEQRVGSLQRLLLAFD